MKKHMTAIADAARSAKSALLVAATLALHPSMALADLVFEHGGHTYKLVETPATWDDAKATAEAMTLAGEPGYLARIDSAAENKALLTAALNHLNDEQVAKSIANDGSDTAFIWLGGSDASQEGRWAWINNDQQFWAGDFNGTAVGGRYSNWGIQPDNAGSGEHSLAMGLGDWPEPFYDLGSAGQWNDLSADTRLFYFVEFESKTDLTVAIEEPVRGGVYSGIRMIRGYAVSTDGVDKIEVLIDGEYAFDLPYGGPHANAGKRFEDIEGSATSGYATPLNFSALQPGEHTVTVRVTDGAGSVKERTSAFTTTRFHKPYILGSDEVDLGWTVTDGLFDRIKVQHAYIDGLPYRVTLRWNTVTQSFDIVDISAQ